MKLQIQAVTKLLSRNILSSIVVIGIMSVAAFAAAPTGGYIPGATLNPDCAPGDTDCSVTVTDNFKFIDGTDADDAIYTTGNVGIGITDPSARLDIDFTSSFEPALELNKTAGYASQALLINSTNSQQAVLINDTTGAITAGAAGTAMKIAGTYQHSGAGGLGRGLDITVNSSATTAGILSGQKISATANNTNATVVGLDVNANSTLGTAYAALFNGGNVGIGTISPDEKLEISTPYGGGNPGFTFQPSSNAAWDSKITYKATTAWHLASLETTYPGSYGGDVRINAHPYNNTPDNNLDTVAIFKGNGNVGIGTINPSSKLHIAGNGAEMLTGLSLENANSDYSFWRSTMNFYRARGTLDVKEDVLNGDMLGTLDFRGYAGGGYRIGASIHTRTDGVPSATSMPSKLSFATTGSGTTAATERLTIKENGNVGIGTTGPNAKLEVIDGTTSLKFQDDSQDNLVLKGNNPTMNIEATSGNPGIALKLNGGTRGFIQSFNTTGKDGLGFAANWLSPQMFLTSAGKFGVGTTDPAEALDVYGKISAKESFELRRSTDNSKKIADITWNAPDNGLLYNNNNGGYHAFSSNVNGEVMRVATSGNVGIGTTIPIGKFTVASSTNGVGVEVYPSATNVAYSYYDRANASYVDVIHRAKNHVFQFGSVEQLRVLQNGDIKMSGDVIVGNNGDSTCGTTQRGAIRIGGDNNFYGCNGISWLQLNN